MAIDADLNGVDRQRRKWRGTLETHGDPIGTDAGGATSPVRHWSNRTSRGRSFGSEIPARPNGYPAIDGIFNYNSPEVQQAVDICWYCSTKKFRAKGSHILRLEKFWLWQLCASYEFKAERRPSPIQENWSGLKLSIAGEQSETSSPVFLPGMWVVWRGTRSYKPR